MNKISNIQKFNIQFNHIVQNLKFASIKNLKSIKTKIKNKLTFTKLPLFLTFGYLYYTNKKEIDEIKNKNYQKNLFSQIFFHKNKILHALKNDENYEGNFLNKKKPDFFGEINKEELMKKYPNLHIINLKSVDILIAKLRDKNLSMKDFRILSKRLVTLIIEEAIALHYNKDIIKESPLGFYKTKNNPNEYRDYVAISILRSGNAMVDELINLYPEISIGKVMLQRDEETTEKLPKFYFEKIPKNIEDKKFLILDPMLATGGSVSNSIEIIINKGAKEENITFINILSCEEGIKAVTAKYPLIKIVTGKVDPILLPNKYLAPGIGDFGDRYYGTTD
jgi:uracil phosphoribosyltransferase